MKLTFKQFFLIPVGIAILAFFLMLVDLGFAKAFDGAKDYFVVWIAFQAWAMYFMAGCTYKDGVKVFLGYLGGAVASVAIMEMAGGMTVLGAMAVPIAVLIVVVPVICSERVPMFDFVPAWFVGAGAFFGLTELQGIASSQRIADATVAALKAGTGVEEITDLAAWGHMDVGIACLLSCVVGMIFGVVTVIGRKKYEATLAANAPAQEAAPADDKE
jgi:hypothetical protein